MHRFEVGNGTGFVEPERMHALHRRGETGRISGRELAFALEGEIGGGMGATHGFKACGAPRGQTRFPGCAYRAWGPGHQGTRGARRDLPLEITCGAASESPVSRMMARALLRVGPPSTR